MKKHEAIGDRHLTTEELEAGLAVIREAPRVNGTLDRIVTRPKDGVREVLEQGQLDVAVGLVGDNWSTRWCRHTPDGSPHPGKQLNVMGSRVAALVARTHERWALAGDQLFIDLDFREDNVPAGTRIVIGEAVIEVTDQPHRGCRKFAERFGLDALKFVNSDRGQELHLRGIAARVVRPGLVRVGDTVRRE